MKRWIQSLVIIGLVGMLCWRGYVLLKQAGLAVHQGPRLHDLAAGASINFVARGATDIHVTSYFVIPKDGAVRTSYALSLAFVMPDGSLREKRVVTLPIATTTPALRLPDGTTAAQSRLLHLLAPPDAALLRIGSPDGRILLHANRLLPQTGTQEAVLLRSGIPATWFTPDEVQGFLPHGWLPLPTLEQTSIVKLPATAVAPSEVDVELDAEVGPMRIGPYRALVYNVVGPGTLTVLSETSDGGNFQLEYLGPGGSGRQTPKAGRATVSLPKGPSSVIIRPFEEKTETVQVWTQNLRALGPKEARIEPAMRPGSAWHLESDKALRFPIYVQDIRPGPMRLNARALPQEDAAPLTSAALRWRFVDKKGKELLTGTLPLENTYDPFTSFVMEGNDHDLGLASKTFLTPPLQAAALELFGPRALVEVDTLLEDSAQSEPLPPFDVALGSDLHWQDVPVRGPRWVMLRPLASQSEQRQIYAALRRTPRIEEISDLPTGPWISVEPQGDVRHLKILEPTQNPILWQEAQTLAATEHDTAVIIEAEGKNAQRVVVTCDLAEQLGGELTLRIDGRRATSVPISTSTVRLSANTSAGIHRVRVDGAPQARCTIAARPEKGAVSIPRTVYQMSPGHSLKLKLSRHGKDPLRLHYAIYSEATHRKDAQFAIVIDGAKPVRQVGSSTSATLGKTTQLLQFAPISLPSHGLHTGDGLSQVAVSAVQLGDDLPKGHHRISLRALSSGRYWARFWIQGRRAKHATAESWITTDLSIPSEVEE